MVAQIVSKLLGQLGSIITEELGSIITEELKGRRRLVIGAEEDVEKLASTFSAIEALLLDAEERQLSEKNVEIWVTKLKNVCYEIDDVLDEWRTEILKRQINQGDDAAGYSWLELKLLEVSNLLKQVCPFLPAYCFSPDEIGLRYDIASRIKQLYEDLERINKDKDMFHFSPRESTRPQSLQTSPNINMSDVEGRESETKILQKKLVQEDSATDNNVRSISIQGAGGFGKTTLAQLLYNDPAIGTHFDKRIWVCVSNTYDPVTVAKTILESLTGSAVQGSILSNMLEAIHRMILGKRFLLVLDDVWEDSQSKWEEIRNAVSCGSLGSRILVTTRKGEASRALGCIQDDVVLIGKLTEDACRAIFTRIAFHGWSAEERELVQGICKDVVKKCNGSPLAAKVLGGVLQSKKGRNEWVKLLKSEMWHLKEVQKEVFRPLALSYYDLPPEIRQCFQFCAVFPQDYRMAKGEIIRLWIAQGFVKAREGQEMENIGEEYFEILATRSFFQDFESVFEGSYCKMHDLVHDFARVVGKNECTNMKSIDKEAATTTLVVAHSRVIRHFMMSSGDPLINDSLYSSMKGLRSFTVNGSNVIKLDRQSHLRGIRSLVLTWCGLKEIPSTINQMIHLRLLDLSGNYELEELPEEICELYNLWSLILNFNRELKKLPDGIGSKLVNLEHLENAFVLAPLPKLIGRLTSLKTLTWFQICMGQREAVARIGELKDMNQLRGDLVVFGLGDVTDSNEVEEAYFAGKSSLTSLELWFGSPFEVVNREGGNHEEKLLEAVKPSANLEKLAIHWYNGFSISPSWMASLTSLTRLEFNYCRKVKDLPPLGGLPSLEELVIKFMDGVKKVGVEFLGIGGQYEQQQQQQAMAVNTFGAFPRLKDLKFDSVEGWEEWDDTMLGFSSVMPRLRSLTLTHCGKLKKLPQSILRKPTLVRLGLHRMACFGSYRFNSEQPEMLPSEVWDEISHIPTIIFDGVDLRAKFKSQIESMDANRASTSSQPAI